jgi:hypothetical protein
MNKFEDRLTRKMGPTALGDLELRETASEGNVLPNRDKLEKN